MLFSSSIPARIFKFWSTSSSIETPVVRSKPAVNNFLRPQGFIDHSNYADLIEAGQRAYAFGFKGMTIDLSQVNEVSTSGLFALYALELIFSGQEAPKAAGGHGALRQMAQYFKSQQKESALHFENVPAEVQALFAEMGISQVR